MKKLLVAFLMLGLIFGTAAVTKAADFGIHFSKDRDRNYGYRSDFDNFSSWEATQRDRINDAYRDNEITQYEFNKLNRELGSIDDYHDRVAAKGWLSYRERNRLERMKDRLSADVDREVGDHMD